MALSKEKKTETLTKLKEVFKKAKSLVFVNFHGLGVDDTNAMRSGLKDQGVNYFVAKKTLIKKALEGMKMDKKTPALDGEIALAYSDDPTSAPRGVYTFQKQHAGHIVIVGGVFDGDLLDQERMMEIAAIPSMDVLRGMFANVLNAPIQGFVVALKAIADKKS